MAKWVGTMAELAQEVGRSVTSLVYYKRKGAPIDKTKRGYNVEAVTEWMRTRLRRKADAPIRRQERPAGNGNAEDVADEGLDPDELYIRERALKTQAQREREQLKYEIESGNYIPLEEVKKRDIERIATVKTGLMALPRRLAQELMGLNANQIEVMLKTRFRELLERFAKM